MTEIGDAPGDLARLRRWAEFGGHWRVESMTATHATVSLCQCDGPRVGTLRTRDPEVLAYLREHPQTVGPGE